MSHPLVFHCKREPFDRYIGRDAYDKERGLYGNPWVIGPDGTRDEVCDRYETWLRTGRDFGHPEATKARRQAILASLPSLKVVRLGCWCFSGQRCHGDTLEALIAELG